MAMLSGTFLADLLAECGWKTGVIHAVHVFGSGARGVHPILKNHRIDADKPGRRGFQPRLVRGLAFASILNHKCTFFGGIRNVP